jgi:glycosyltransferase involved in cell wall biosynthesis
MLTKLTLKMVLMITYLSHWDWILYKSRKDLIKYINSDEIYAMCPRGAYEIGLESTYNGVTSWELDRRKLLDIKAVLMLRSHIKRINSSFHCFTLKTGILYCLANIFVKNKHKAVLSITGLGFLFSNSLQARLLRLIVKPFIRNLFNKSFDVIIFQNHSDEKLFLKFSRFSNKTKLIPSSGIEIDNFKKRINIPNNLAKKKVILVSRLLYDKGIFDYMNLVNKVNKEKVEFYLAGERDDGNPQNISDNDMELILNQENLNYIGKIDVESELSKFDISIIMSSHEGFSRILLESLYVGLYCLAYKIQGTEVMKAFENLELIELNHIDKFVEFIENFDEIEDNSKNIQLTEKLYASQVVASQFESIYKELGIVD